MAYLVDWISKVITVPVADLTLVSGTRYQLNLEHFLNEIRRLEWEFSEGLWAQYILEHSDTRFDFAGANYAAFDEVVNGYTVTIGAGAVTRVDLIGSNNNIADVINNTNIILVSANSAGLTNISEIRSTAFNGKVVMNSDTGFDSIVYPTGTLKRPAKFLDDGKFIADEEGVVDFLFKSNMTITGIDFSAGYNFSASSPSKLITIDPSADVAGCSFRNMTATGQFDGVNLLERMKAIACTNLGGFAESVSFEGANSLLGDMELLNCFSGEPLDGKPSLNIGGNDIQIANWVKSIEITGATAGSTGTIHLTGGRIYFDNTNVDGTINVRGEPFEIIDNSGPGFTVVDQTESVKVNDIHGQVARELWFDSAVATDGNGYQQTPYKVLNNLIDDAEASGITSINTYSDIALTRDLKNIKLSGIGMPTFDAAGYDLKGMEFWHLRFEGLSTSPFIIQQCRILQGAGLYGHSELCTFYGDVHLTGATDIINGVSGKEGAGYISIDTNGFGLQVTNWHRSLGISNMTGGVHTIEMYGGQLHLDAGCTGGIIHLRGDYSLPPDNLGSTTIIDGTGSKKRDDIHKANFNRRNHDTTAKTVTLYEDDKVTPKQVWDAPDDLSELTPQ